MNFTSLFTSFSGRINRAPYWIGVLILSVLSLIIGVGFVSTLLSPGAGAGGLIALIVLGLLLFVASIPITVKRLHDRGKSGHYAWLLYGSSVVGGAVDPWTQGTMQVNPFGMIVALVTVVIGLWFFVELGFFRGTAGPNTYGPDPLEGR
jgi:uncharacterized membrane protein YhaH (DUF805 family)